jgi:hypothetical protein
MTAAAMAVRLSGGSWSPILELSGIVVVGAAVYVATISVVAPGLIPQTARRFRNG